MPCSVVYSDQLVAHNIHVHTNYELLYVTEGEVTMVLGASRYRLQSGSMIFLNQFEEHATQLCSGVYRRYYLLIPPAELPSFHESSALFSVFRLHGARFPYVLAAGPLKPRFDLYFDLLAEASASTEAHREERMRALITLILTDAHRLRPDMFAAPKEQAIIDLPAIMDELDQGFAGDLSLSALAARHHVSTGYLSRCFREHVGMSPMQYIMQSRLTHAKHLLMDSSLSVGDIALRCGVKDVSNFIRRFKAQFGLSPHQFRLANRGTPQPLTPNQA